MPTPKASNLAQNRKANPDPTERVKLYSAVRTLDGRTFTEYTLSYYIGGKRKRPSFTDKAKADAEKERIERLLAAGHEAAATATADDLALFQLFRKQFPEVSPHEVFRHYLETHDDYAERKRVPTVSELAEEIIKDRDAKAKEEPRYRRNAQTLRSHLRRFADAFRRPIDAVTVKEIEGYLDRNFTAPKTRDNHRISILLLFNEARRMGHLPYHKPHAAQLVKAPKKGSLTGVREHAAYSLDELMRILAGAR